MTTVLLRTSHPALSISVPVALFLFLGTATPAKSQTLVAGAGAGVSIEDGNAGGSYGVNPGLSGRSAAWDWFAGMNVSRRVAVVFEASLARPYEKEQSDVRRFERTHKDDMYSGMLHLRVHDRFTIVGGISRVRFETTEVYFIVRRPTPAITMEEGPFRSPDHRGWSTGAVVGFDLLPFQWRNITAGPAVRVFIYDHVDEGLIPHFGYGSYAVRVGGRIHLRF
jgi:hypothetical protein